MKTDMHKKTTHHLRRSLINVPDIDRVIILPVEIILVLHSNEMEFQN
jgi:hypothetical protein